MRAGLVTQKVVDYLIEHNAPKDIVSYVKTLYAVAYKEGYRDGTTDCEEKLAEERDDVEEL